MIVTKKCTASAHVPARRRRNTGAAAIGRDDSGAHGGIRRRQRLAARRLGFVYIPMGTHQPLWIPTTEGRITELSPILSSLTPHLNQTTVVSNLQLKNAYSSGADHATANCHVPERRSSEENRRQRLRAGDDRRSDRRASRSAPRLRFRHSSSQRISTTSSAIATTAMPVST